MKYIQDRTSLSRTLKSVFPISIPLLMVLIVAGCSTEKDFNTSVSISEDKWYFNGEVLNPGSPAEGLLMNVRMVNSVFEDRGPELEKRTDDFSAEANTEAFIAKIPEYVSSGVNAFTISLQGGMPGYEGAINTAFNSDGSLRDDYMQRVEKVIRACDENNAAVILTLFYQRQHSHHSALDGRESILNALENAVEWITSKGFTNVVLEVSNEYGHGGYQNWPDGEWLMSESGQIELIRLAKQLNPELLVSTSGMGNGVYPEDLANESDFILIHLNTTSLDLYKNRIEDVQKYGKPVVSNEDDKLGPEGAAAQALAVMNGSSWGYMGMLRNQYFPFEYRGKEDDPDVYEMFRNLTTPGFQVDSESLEQTSITINYPHDGEIFRLGEAIELNLSHLYSDDSEAVDIELLANGEQITVIDNGIRLRVVWEPDEPGIYDFQAVVRDESGEELYRSAEVDVIVQNDQ